MENSYRGLDVNADQRENLNFTEVLGVGSEINFQWQLNRVNLKIGGITDRNRNKMKKMEWGERHSE